MPSPFPGMDPYLEGEMWQEFHERLANQISQQLLPLLKPNYVAFLAKRYVRNRPSPTIMSIEAVTKALYPDVPIVRHGGGVALAPAPVRSRLKTELASPFEVISPMGEEVPVLGVEIRDTANRRLVTAIDILLPVNKLGEGAREYDERRQELLRTPTHLLEIDLIRRGHRIVVEGQLPSAPYYIYLSRFYRRPITEVWAVQLPERLPVVPVPLLPPDPDVTLDLQAAVDACFELVGYENLLDYTQPPPPPLAPAEADWAAAQVRA